MVDTESDLLVMINAVVFLQDVDNRVASVPAEIQLQLFKLGQSGSGERQRILSVAV